VTPPGAGFTARQKALAARVAALDATGAHYALFHRAFGSEADMDALEHALSGADRYQVELRQAAAKLRAAAAPRAGRPQAAAGSDAARVPR
jgi:hypothetical protein